MDTPRQGITVLALSSAILGMGAFFSLFLEQLEINGGIASGGFPSPILIGILLLAVLIIIVALLTKIARLLAEIRDRVYVPQNRPEYPATPVQVQNERNFEHRDKPSKQLLKAVAWIEAHGTGLTVREIAKAAGVSVGTAHNAREFIKSQRGSLAP